MATNSCCAECGNDGGVRLKVCKACMQVRYCSADCQKNHWPKHKKDCKERAAELRDELLFKDPPAKEECPICFLPMPIDLICCISLPPATVSSVPIHDYATANEELVKIDTAHYFPCCGKRICGGCVHSCIQSGNTRKCPFCNSDRGGQTDGELVAEMMKRVAANDAASINLLAHHYHRGQLGVQQDHAKAMELYTRAADLGCSKAHQHMADSYHEGGAHNELGNIYYEGGDMKKAKFHFKAAAMAGNEVARYNLGCLEAESGNIERAIKHWAIAASAGYHKAMFQLKIGFENGYVSRESIDSTLAAYNSSCAEMRSEARDSSIRAIAKTI